MNPERGSPVDIEALKRSVDLLELASHYTQLRQFSRTGEYAGPCPRCGGEDRFHVKGQRFYCRQCYPRGGDVIDFVRIVHNVSFAEACRLLGSETFLFSERQNLPTPRADSETREEQSDWRSEAFQTSARRTVAATQRLLRSDVGAPGQKYLRSRNLTEETWRAYHLGYGRTFHPLRQTNMEAIFIPWFTQDRGQIMAIQHRFIDPSVGKGERYTFKPGSQMVVFGIQALARAETIVVVEGEFNCMALHEVGVQAISVGSESNTLGDTTLGALSPIIASYARILIWFDDLAKGEQLAERFGEIMPFRKEKLGVVTYPNDANDLLVAGELATVSNSLQ